MYKGIEGLTFASSARIEVLRFFEIFELPRRPQDIWKRLQLPIGHLGELHVEFIALPC